VEEQIRLSVEVVLRDGFDEIKYVAGVDSAFLNEKIISSAILMDYDSMKVIEKEYHIGEVDFPYIPGLLFYREGKNTLKAINQLKIDPDIIIFDGGGINHPRGIGLASHIGVLLKKPTIGVVKNMFSGHCDTPKDVGEEKPIILNGKKIGYAYKSKKVAKPIYITPGNLISVDSAFFVVKHFIRGYKLPEPVREAHMFAGEMKDRNP
jgi:deoxyribonuclease V